MLKWLCALVALLVLATAAPSAWADGDPASDVLLGESVFYPYTPPVSGAVQKALNAETSAAAKAHWPLKVALIGSPIDLGVIPDLFGHPQKYADFLDQEISFQTRQPLLVVMATGYGVQGVPPAVTAAAATLPKPASTASNDLAKAAITAVSRLARAAGHPIASTSSSSGGSTGSGAGLVIGLAALAVLIAGGLVAARRRAARRRAGSAPGDALRRR